MPSRLELSLDNVLQHLLVQRQVGDNSLQATVFFFTLFETAHLGRQITAANMRRPKK